MNTRIFILAVPALLVAGPAFAGGGAHGDAHGIPWGPIGMHALNLVVLLGFLAFVLRNRIPDALKARRAGIAKAISDAAEERSAAQARFDDLVSRLSGFEEELAAMRRDAETEAARERQSILDQAEASARSIQESAARAIQNETARAQRSLRADAARLAVDVAAQQIQANITAEDEGRLTAEFLSAFTTDAAAGAGVDHG